MSEYENETCEGCVFADYKPGGAFCVHESGFNCTHETEDGGKLIHTKCVWLHERCEHFHPSLQCRQVRALERQELQLAYVCRRLADIVEELRLKGSG